MAKYQTVSGHVIEYDETPEVVAFLRRLRALVDDPKAGVHEVTGLAYSRENPILDQTIFPTRGAVTKEVLANPTYAVVSDLVFRKEAAVHGFDLEEMAERHTLTVAEAAERLGVHVSAVRQAIAARRLPSWIRDGRTYIDPASLQALKVWTRGKAESVKPGGDLRVRIGHRSGISLRVKHPGELLEKERVGANIIDGKIVGWRRVVLISRIEEKMRLFVLEPGDVEEEYAVGPFFVRGPFRIVSKENNAQRANEAWKAEKAQ